MNKNIISLLIPEETQLFSQWAYNYYFTEILRGAVASASLFEWEILVSYNKLNSAEDIEEYCEKKNVSGLIFLSPITNTEALKKASVPLIVVNERYQDISYIDTNNNYGSRQAVDYLIELGHSKIAIITGDMSTTNAKDRLEGYKYAVSKAGIEILEDYICLGNFMEDAGITYMKELLELPTPPTAVLCANDLVAIGAINAVKQAGLSVPEDVSIIGFDDLIISKYQCPPLTTVRQQLFNLGKEGVMTLMSIIRGDRGKNQAVEVETRLIKRESTAAPK